jgi:fibro-slime domain-containing protein
VESGWVCPDGKTCRATKCGDNVKEGSEQCDDNNLIPYDGCSPTCTVEPKCANGACSAFCGDGFKFDQEGCDDGNIRSGDGCSADCKEEPGWKCPPVTQDPPASLVVPILIRDLMYSGTPEVTGAHPIGHPDFEYAEFTPDRSTNARTCTFKDGSNNDLPTTGMVDSALDSYGKPVLKSVKGNNPCRDQVTSADSFRTWYHDDSNVYASRVGSTLTLTRQGTTTTYRFNSQSFFPVNGQGWQTTAACASCSSATTAPDWCRQCPGTTRYDGNNFSFTSELRYPFTFNGGESLEFYGDDDVWVFVNGILAVDLGGIHSQVDGKITLTTDTADPTVNTQFNLKVGGMYEIAVFQAERHVIFSHYQLTIGGFVHKLSTCTPDCGDGIVTGTEACDLGRDKNTGAYGGCTDKCALSPYCGDELTQSPQEQCDDGNNVTLYDKTKKSCAPGCVLPHYCGDGSVDSAYGEACDKGADNKAAGAYGPELCTTDCTPVAYCGDGTKNGPEQCDDGVNNGTPSSSCDTACLFKCGNAVLEAGEQCDLGSAKNIGGYDGCNANCTRGPYCGDGVKEGPEQCDDGKNDGSYGTCSQGCILAGYCGDGTLQNPPERCDQGPNNSPDSYGSGLCTNQCAPAPYCGDKSVDSQFGEKCDDGVNSGLPGSCKPDCSGWVPLNTCGNGTLDSGEQCDDGPNTGNVLSNCDSHCRIKCGNGVIDVGELCDDGINDGSYGGCTPTCQYAGYCGDGTVNGTEQCDLGDANEASPYGKGKCNKACQNAPYCGDGRVQAPEVCDGQSNCTISCTWWVPLYY